MAQPIVIIKLDLPQYSLLMADRLGQLLHAEVRNQAKKYVAHPGSAHPYSKGPLRDSIKMRRLGVCNYVVWAGSDSVPYAAAQEYGLAAYGKPNYTFTPYMRPAAQGATTPAKLKELVMKAEIAARRIAARGTQGRYTG